MSPAPPVKPYLQPWPRLGLFCAAFVLLSYVNGALWSLVPLGTDGDERLLPWISVLYAAQVAAGLGAVTFLFWKYVDGRRWTDLPLGLSAPHAWLRGGALAAARLAPGLLLPLLLGQSRLMQVSTPEPTHLLETALAVVGMLVYAVAWEAAFRGYLLQNLLEVLGAGKAVWASAVLGSLCYALVQPASRLSLLDFLIVSAALAYLRLGCGTLAPAVAFTFLDGVAPYLISTDPYWGSWMVLGQPRSVLWFGFAHESGLIHIWMSFLVLAAIYFRFYLPTSLQPALEDGRDAPIARIRPRPRLPK